MSERCSLCLKSALRLERLSEQGPGRGRTEAIIAADVRRFGHVINTDGVLCGLHCLQPFCPTGYQWSSLSLKVGGQNAAVRRVSQARRHDGGGHVMTLTLRPTGLAAPVDGDHKDFIVMSGEFVLGRIYEECGARPELRWYWAINGVHAGPTVMRKDGRARSLEGAKAQFAHNWQKCLAWAGLKEVE